jgi:DNA-binding MarR family transcriptional regulator
VNYLEYQTMLALRMLNSSIRRHIDASQTKQELDHIIGVHGWIIGYLAEHEGEEIYQRDLERDLCICRSAVSKIVAVLEKSGLIERERVASDDRLKKLILTERGKAYTEQIRADNQAIEQQLTDGFSQEELAALHHYLQKMQQNLTKN